MGRVSATHARVHFGEILRQVAETGDAVVVERGGRPLAVLVSVREYERLKGGESWRAALEQARKVRQRTRREMGKRPRPTIEEIIRAGREERDLGLSHLR